MKIFFVIFIFFIFLFAFFAYNYQEKLIFFPEKLPRDFSFSFPFVHEEIYLKARDNSEIHGIFFPAKNPKGAILYFHGNAGSLRTWGYIAGDFLPMGYSVLVMDYRGYGKSSPGLTEKNILEDSEIAYEFLKSRVGEEKIIIYGRSIGTAIAVHLASVTRPKILILESPFTNLAELAKYHYPILPSFFLKFQLNSESKIRNIQCPAYIFHGTEDTIIPVSFGEKLAKLSPNPVKFYKISGADHNNLNEFTEYWKILRDIIQDFN